MGSPGLILGPITGHCWRFVGHRKKKKKKAEADTFRLDFTVYSHKEKQNLGKI